MKLLKSMNYGSRGWLLMIYQFLAFVAFTVFTNWPMNVLADMYGGSAKVSSIYTSGVLVSIVIQLILSVFMGKIKSVKRVGIIFGGIAMVFSLLIMVISPEKLSVWQVCYFVVCVFVPMWATFSVSMLVGQWFPTKKVLLWELQRLHFRL